MTKEHDKLSFPRKRESRKKIESLTLDNLDSRFRGNDTRKKTLKPSPEGEGCKATAAPLGRAVRGLAAAAKRFLMTQN